jgi:predicted transcriptional regulator
VISKLTLDQKKEEIGYTELIAVFEKLKLIHIQILKTLYVNDMPVSYKELWNQYKIIKISERTFKKRIHELRDLGIIDCINSWVLTLLPKTEIRDQILKQITAYYGKLESNNENIRF